ncbi:MAG TPA: VOC family protein [Stellaceae bacterium]|nr:VOC family protein [Stellaceae bacterium]
MSVPALDHLVVDVGAELDDAAARYRALGFTLTERGRHSLGSTNHLAVFETNYLELLSTGPAGGPIREELVGFAPGLNGLVLATDDADARAGDLRARGVRVREPQSFSRPVRLADGEVRDARFRTVHLARDEAPFGRLYFCQHDTRDLVWRPEWQTHPNGVREITGVLVCAADPALTARLFARLFDAAPAPAEEGQGLRVIAGAVAIDIASREAAARRLGAALPAAAGRDTFLAAIRLRTQSLRQAAGLVGPSAGAAPRDGRLIVPAAAACNVALEFVE